MRHRTSKRQKRHGAVLVAVLVMLMVASVLLAAMLRTGREEQQLLRAQHLRLQAMELAQAGFERAVARLQADASFTQETWRVVAADLGGRDDALIKLDVTTTADRPDHRRVRVEVNYPPTGPRRVQQHREVWIDLAGEETP
jgi:Tfp pilus assembly protein PilX